ncbi:MAG TPA: bile acid:sodium symporter [Myxococcaceae bacterium]|nr:bile acid:sodium symporter [Myxococcaceae bacterium]
MAGALALACVAGLLWPGTGAVIAHLRVTSSLGVGAYDVAGWALMLIMISAGMRVRLPEVRQLTTHWRAGLGVVGVNGLLVPGLAVAAGHIAARSMGGAPGEEIRFGFLCVALAPVAFSSAFWVQHNGGNGAITMGALGLSALAAAWTFPTLGVPVEGVLVRLFFMGLLPWLFGLTLRQAIPQNADHVGRWIRTVGALALLVSVWLQVSQAAPYLASLHTARLWPVVAVVVAFNVAAFGVGFIVAKTLGLLHPDAVALTFLSGMRAVDVALVVAFAGVPLSPWAALPAAVFALSQQLLAAWLTRYTRHFERSGLGRTVGTGLGSLQAQLDKLYAGGPISRVGGVTLLVFEVSSKIPLARARVFEQVVLPLTQRLRCTDYVSELPPNRFALVCLNTPPTAAEAIVRKVKETLPLGSSVRWGVCHSSWVGSAAQLVVSAVGAVALFNDPKLSAAPPQGSSALMSISAIDL